MRLRVSFSAFCLEKLNKLLKELLRCFEKSNKKHSPECKKQMNRVVNGLEACNSKFQPFQDTTIYAASFNKQNKNSKIDSTDNNPNNLEHLDQVSKVS